MSATDFDPVPILASPLSISDKIRRLAEGGCTRRQIADLIGRSYQQVRQVLVEDERRAARNRVPSGPEQRFAGVGEAAPNDEWASTTGTYRLSIRDDGSVVLPSAVLAVLGAKRGHVLVSQLQDDRLIVFSGRAAAERARALFQASIPPGMEGRSLVDELLEDRRREAEADRHG